MRASTGAASAVPNPPKATPADAAGAAVLTDVEPAGLMALSEPLFASRPANTDDRTGPTNLDWCVAEARRINQIPGRRAVVYRHGVKGVRCTLYVNRVAGVPGLED